MFLNISENYSENRDTTGVEKMFFNSISVLFFIKDYGHTFASQEIPSGYVGTICLVFKLNCLPWNCWEFFLKSFDKMKDIEIVQVDFLLLQNVCPHILENGHISFFPVFTLTKVLSFRIFEAKLLLRNNLLSNLDTIVS